MTWPDPNCPANHKAGATYKPWQHTPDCNIRTPRRVKKDRNFSDTDAAVLHATEGETVVERARESGAL
jgi:hypothetical protein